MKIYNITMTLDSDTIKKCEDFANNSIHTNINEYKRRNQSNPEKIKFDIITGKKAEFAVYNYLISKDKICTEPDLNVYTARKKNFNADLLCEDREIHVKSQDKKQADKYTMSWTFHITDKLTTVPSENDYICLCIVDNDKVEIKTIEKASFFVGKYGEPKLHQLKNSKKVIYFAEIL